MSYLKPDILIRIANPIPNFIIASFGNEGWASVIWQ